MPKLVEPGTIIGQVSEVVVEQAGCLEGAVVNVGTLDHFAGMIGTGNIVKGMVSESTGTVMSIATLLDKPAFERQIPCHYGPFQDKYVLLPVCESGGVSLEWFKNQCLTDLDYREINEKLSLRDLPNEVVFMPYLTGGECTGIR